MRISIAHKAARFLQLLFLLLFIVLCGWIGVELFRTSQTVQINVDLRQTYQRVENTVEDVEDWSHGMLELNPDYIGWLKVDGTSIDLPVVMAEDNDYYLRRDFYGNYLFAGTLFADYRTETVPHGNLTIYGHHMKDDTMFGELEFFKKPDFFKQNGLITLEKETGIHHYRVFSVAVLPGEAGSSGYIDLHQWCNVLSDEQSKQMLEELHDRSAMWKNTIHMSGDRYLFLVTCDYSRTNGRLLVAAQEIKTMNDMEE